MSHEIKLENDAKKHVNMIVIIPALKLTMIFANRQI